jgi:glycosyltransferase involved in cell wall biosynthesis
MSHVAPGGTPGLAAASLPAGSRVAALSVVIPSYNEEASVGATIERVSAAVRAAGIPHEILAVNDGSGDRTGEVVRSLQPRIPELRLVEHFPNRGYGGALRAGFEAARHDWIAFLPGDNQFDPSDLGRLVEQAGHADIVSGFRADRQDALMRKVNAFGWNLVVRLLFGRLCRDVDCGFKLFRRAVLDRVTITSAGAMIDTELLAGAKARGFVIVDVAVTHLPRTTGHPTGANIRVIARAFRDLGRFRLRLSRELKNERRWKTDAC